jgi:hypothetical protein
VAEGVALPSGQSLIFDASMGTNRLGRVPGSNSSSRGLLGDDSGNSDTNIQPPAASDLLSMWCARIAVVALYITETASRVLLL